MGKIVIIDDDKVFLDYFKQKLETYTNGEVTCINRIDYEYLLNNDLDLVFLDIELTEGRSTGFDVARRLNEKKEKPILIFVSNRGDWIHDSLDVQPFYFMRKDHLDNDLRTAFMLLKSINFREGLELSIGNKIIDVYKILYIRASRNYLDCFMTNGTIRIRAKINEVGDMLEEHEFSRIHRSCIVNLRYVAKCDGTTLILKNGQSLKISNKYQESIMEKYKKMRLNRYI